MPDLVLKSERQSQIDVISVILAELGINDINPGSGLDVLTQSIAQENFNLYYQVALVARLADIDALSGDDLDDKGFEYGLTRLVALKASGPIKIQRAEGFVKVSTQFYTGSPAPLSGNTTIDVADASNVLISTSGTLILGRGTNNEEEVTYSIAPVDNTLFFTFTLDAPLANDHAIEETVILKQGSDELISAGTAVIVQATSTNAQIDFSLDNDATLLAGEAEILNIPVTAALTGSDSNIQLQAINGTAAVFPSDPFIGARAENTTKFSSGRDAELDDELRDRIKQTIGTLSKGIKEAITQAIVGLVDVDTAKRVVSSSVVVPVDECGAVKVYIDDGTGFEPNFTKTGLEAVLSSATAGTQRLQVDNFPMVKAQLETVNTGTYDMSAGGLTLIYTVGTTSETLTFENSDFSNIAAATTNEIVAAINDRSTILEARTAQGGSNVTINGITDTNENIQVTGGTSNSILGFPTTLQTTANLYINDVLQSKDGTTAILDSGNTGTYDLLAIGAYPHTLVLVVDGKTANTQTATIALVDVSLSNAVTTAEIITVINRDIAGLTAAGISSNTLIRLESNTTFSSASKINVTGGTANDVTNGLNFSTVEVTGTDKDYELNRELGIIELTSALTVNDTVTLGSAFTRGFLRAAQAETYAPSTGQTLVIAVDGGGDQTVTFDASFAAGKTAQLTSDFINLTLLGASATVRTVGGSNFVEIATDTYNAGDIEIKSASTANGVFGFVLDTIATSISPNRAFRVSSNAGPYEFAPNDTLIVVIDDNTQDNTFTVLMQFAAAATSGASTTVFASTALTAIFPLDDELIDYFAVWTSGTNTETGTIVTVTDQGGGQFRYTFSPTPGDFGDYAAGDVFGVSGLDNVENDGDFIIDAVGAAFVDVTNVAGIAASSQTGAATLGQRRAITDYVTATGTITVGAPLANTPIATEDFIIIPGSTTNVVDFMGKTKLNSLPLKATVEGVDNNTKVQISSQNNGSDGFVQVTGGDANIEFGFLTIILQGVPAYSFFTGLLRLVHRTIYGDDTDLVTFPGVGAAGVVFRVLAPTIRRVAIELDVTLEEGVTLAGLDNEMKSAVTGYINTLGVGKDVIIEEIRSAVIRIIGVRDVVLTAPAANIPVADNEIPRVSDSEIIIG